MCYALIIYLVFQFIKWDILVFKISKILIYLYKVRV